MRDFNPNLDFKIMFGIVFLFIIVVAIAVIFGSNEADYICNSNYALDNSTENKAYAIVNNGKIIKCCADVVPMKYEREGASAFIFGEQGTYYKQICVDVE